MKEEELKKDILEEVYKRKTAEEFLNGKNARELEGQLKIGDYF